MRWLLSTIIDQQVYFWEGFIRAFDLFGMMEHRTDWNVDPRVVDREAIRSDWEQTRLDLWQGHRDLIGAQNCDDHRV